MSTSDHAGPVGDVGRRNDDVIERFDAHEAALGRTGEQVRQRRRLLYRLADVCAPRSLFEATKQDVLEVLEQLSQRPKTRNYYLSRYAGFYRWAIAEDLCEADPTMKIQRAPQPRAVPRPVSEDQLGAALRAADPRMRVILCLAAFAGLRCKEIAGLRAEHLLESPDRILVVEGKGGHERIVPMNPAVRAAIEAYGWPTSGPVVRRRRGGSRRGQHGADANLSSHRISDLVADYLRSVGIDATAHQLRHFFGTNVYQATRDILLTRDMMGHSTARTTEGYTRVVLDERATEAIAGIVLEGAAHEAPIEEPMPLELAMEVGLDDETLAELGGVALFEGEVNTRDERLEAARQWREIARTFAEGTGNERIVGPLTREERADRARRATWVAQVLEDDALRARLVAQLPDAIVEEYRATTNEVLDARRRPYPLDVDLVDSAWSCVNCGTGFEAGAAEALIVHDRHEETSQPIRYCAACVSLAAEALKR